MNRMGAAHSLPSLHFLKGQRGPSGVSQQLAQANSKSMVSHL